MTPFSLLRAVVPTPNTHVPSDNFAIVICVLIVLALAAGGIAALRKRNGRKSGNGGGK